MAADMLHHGSVSASFPEERGISRGVVTAGVATAVGALPLVIGMSQPQLPLGAVRGAGWVAFGIVGALLLDRSPRSRTGWVATGLTLIPAVTLGAAVVTSTRSAPTWDLLDRTWQTLSVLPVVATIAAIAWSVGLAPDRMARRRMVWLTTWSALLVAAVVAASSLGGPRAVAAVTTLGLWGLAALVVRLVLSPELRPVDEPLVDAAAVLAALACGAGVGVLVGLASRRAGMPAPQLSAVFAAVASAALILPGAMWLRTAFLERRYGAGTLSPGDVAAITADLHTQTDARELLEKAAAMVSVASGHLEVTMLPGPDGPETTGTHAQSARAVAYPLVVGGDRVGTLVVVPRHPEGLEPRQARTVTQLLPTLALVARAVSLAVEADHARADVARERDAERARILGDLHDGLGPALAGLSMRVQAEVRTGPTPLLEALARELADCRGELRRIVSGLTPSALTHDGLEGALDRLVASFAGGGPGVVLETALTTQPCAEVAVAAYRSVAEGLTNALRHARAETVRVRVTSTADGGLLVDVVDDGVGGPIAPGVGLTSLRRRAEHLGGALVIEPGERAGTHLSVLLPATGAAA